MSTSHTPGPWIVAGNIIWRDAGHVAGCRQIATMNGTELLTDQSETAANAALIASAPDLLAQRDALAAALRILTNYMCSDDYTYVITSDDMEIARAALTGVRS